MEIEKKDDIRNIIIKEASKLFIQQGYTKTTIRQIATVCNLGRGHLYYYFNKKEDIILYLYKNLIEQIYTYINKSTKQTLDPLISYAMTQSIYIKTIATNESLFRMYIEASEIDTLRKEYLNTLRDILNKYLGELNFKFDSNDINLSIIIGSAGEDELLRRFYNNDTNLSLDEIIKSTIKTRLLLLNIHQEDVNSILIKSQLEINNISIDEIIKNINTLDI